MSEASDLSGLARGLAFRLAETLGVLRRDAVSSEVKELDQSARAQLRAYGVRFGAFNIYMPALLKPAAADLLLLLWALHAGRNYGLDADALPPRPQQGLTSVEADAKIPEPYWHAAGFQVAGARAIRIDMLERLSDLIRARVSWRQVEGGAAAPSGATGDGGFRAAPELMSVVGCSGEDFASILKALGFRRERRKLAETEAPTVEATEATNGAEAVDATAAPAASEPAFEEIWRPGKRKDARKPHDTQARPKPPRRRERQAQAPRQREPRPPRVERKEHRARRTRRLSPCLPSFAAISPPAVPRATDACTMLGQRLDKWLWCARLVKTRTLAARLIEAGKIRINGERTLKVSRPVRAGDVVTGVSARAGRLFVVRVAGEAERRGPATVARTLYEDLTPAAPAPPSNVARERARPTKRDRRRLDAIKADDA